MSTLKSKAKAKKKAISAQLAKENAEKLQKISREHSLTQLLMAHLEMCVAVGSPDKVSHIHNITPLHFEGYNNVNISGVGATLIIKFHAVVKDSRYM